MGCACEGYRLADLVAVMADNEIFEEEALKNPFDYDKRPVHAAFLNKKLPCPRQFCSKNLIFFEEGGLDHHMRAIHRVLTFIGYSY